MLKKHPRFERDSAPRFLKRFCPHYHVKTLSEIEPADLVAAGMKGVLLDLDNTLLPWKLDEIPPDTVAWVKKCQEAGLKLCLVSNTRNVPRLKSISDILNVTTVTAKMKPSREGFRRALNLIGYSASEVVMIGDQMFTDVWGGNRMGICTIWVERMHHHEFFATKISRFFERVVLKLLGRAKGKPTS